MGKSKTYFGNYQLTAAFAKALAHPVRLMIIDILSENGNMTLGDLAGKLPVSTPTVTQHIKPLKEAGLIDCRRQTPFVVYFLVKDKMEECRKTLLSAIPE